MSIANLKRQNAQGSYPSQIDLQHLRHQEFGFISLAAQGTPIILSGANVDVLKTSWGAPAVQLPVFSRNTTAATASALTCTFPDADATAALMSVSFVTAHTGFRVIPRLSDQSDIVTEAQDFMRQYTDAEIALATYLEGQMASTIAGAVGSTFNSAFVGAAARYNTANNLLQVTTGSQAGFFNDMKAIMGADNFPKTGLAVIGDAQLPSYYDSYVSQGAANSTNQSYQFAGYEFSSSNSISTTAGAMSTGYAMPIGSLGMVSRVSPDALANAVSEGSGIRWSVEDSQLMPGVQMELMVKDSCADVSAITGNAIDQAALVKHYQLGISVAILTPYVGAATNTGIKGFDFL
tara:strand:- start:214 stop:1260 length:1047 start_codon:yes stop_codon:yes gene_type:complete